MILYVNARSTRSVRWEHRQESGDQSISHSAEGITRRTDETVRKVGMGFTDGEGDKHW